MRLTQKKERMYCGHQGAYLAKIHKNGGCGHLRPYLEQMPSINHDICKIKASVSE